MQTSNRARMVRWDATPSLKLSQLETCSPSSHQNLHSAVSRLSMFCHTFGRTAVNPVCLCSFALCRHICLLSSLALSGRYISAPNDTQQGTPVRELYVGARVRVKKSVTSPRYGWGSASSSCIGTLTKITDDGNVEIGETLKQFESLSLGKV